MGIPYQMHALQFHFFFLWLCTLKPGTFVLFWDLKLLLNLNLAVFVVVIACSFHDPSKKVLFNLKPHFHFSSLSFCSNSSLVSTSILGLQCISQWFPCLVWSGVGVCVQLCAFTVAIWLSKHHLLKRSSLPHVVLGPFWIVGISFWTCVDTFLSRYTMLC